jgi:hypothetical protein
MDLPMLLQDPTQTPPAAPASPIICAHTKKPCEHVGYLYSAVSQLRAAVNRSVLIGAAIGAGLGTAAKDLLQAWLG